MDNMILKNSIKHSLSPEYLVAKSNAITSMRNIDSMNLHQLKLFYIYLSKVNPKNTDTREIIISLKDYIYIMGKRYAMRPNQLMKLSKTMVTITATVPLYDEENTFTGFSTYSIFNKFSMYQDKKDKNWYVKIVCNDELVPHFFDLKSHYSSFKLWNISGLNSVTQIRLYDVLQQYKKIQKVKFELNELKTMIGANGYTRWDNLKSKVLEPCKELFKEQTDIIFEYKPIMGLRRKTIGIEFFVSENPQAQENRQKIYNEFNYEFDDFVKDLVPPEDLQKEPAIIQAMAENTGGEFSISQLHIIYKILKEITLTDDEMLESPLSFAATHFLQKLNEAYQYTLKRAPKNNFSYLKRILNNKLKDVQNGNQVTWF